MADCKTKAVKDVKDGVEPAVPFSLVDMTSADIRSGIMHHVMALKDRWAAGDPKFFEAVLKRTGTVSPRSSDHFHLSFLCDDGHNISLTVWKDHVVFVGGDWFVKINAELVEDKLQVFHIFPIIHIPSGETKTRVEWDSGAGRFSVKTSLDKGTILNIANGIASVGWFLGVDPKPTHLTILELF